jgi:hypothetical protein
MTRKILFPILILALAVMSCNLPSAIPVTPSPLPVVSTDTQLPPTSTSTAAPTNTPVPPLTPLPGGLTLDTLKNATYHTPFYDRTITLVNGAYSEGTNPVTYSVQLLGVYAFGDMNGDGKDDAAVILAENGGGSGTFESLVVMSNLAGAPHQAGEAQLGDRVHINSVDISSDVVHLDMLVQGPADALCCPSLPEKQNYWLFGTRLFLMRLTTTFADTERIIAINSPAHWSSVTNPFTVDGNVTVLPFENTLAYKIYLIDGTKVNEGSLTVTPTTATPGVFSQTFDLSSAGITDWVIIQFVDVSAADGSTIAMGSVILKAH